MSDQDPMSGTHDCGGDAAAYALGALDPVEAEAFERHMLDCTVCRDEVTALQEIANALPMAAPQHRSPTALRQRVLSAVRDEASAGATGRSHRRLIRGRRGWARRGVVLAGACAAIALAVLAGLDLSSGNHARIIQARVSGISGSASVHLTGGRGELIVRHLSPPPPGDIYQMWLKRPHRPPRPYQRAFQRHLYGRR